MGTAPEEVLRLVERFDANREEYRGGRYNETQVRREFIDPFFIALGWDVGNRAGYAEAYKDVVHEDAIKVGGTTKAPDYCFRVGGARKFFVEAKSPSHDVAGDPGPAYQLRRYGWSAKLQLSILTDFEEFAVYDCRTRPKPTDKASATRVKYLTFDRYADEWDAIASVFSRDAVLKGGFDRFVEREKKRGTAEVDDEFLKEIERWRDALARNIAIRNPKLSVRELNFAVGRIIDRIIFLRMCEDRGIEAGMPLRAISNGTEVYPRLARLFIDADNRYNSGLFHFHKEPGREDPDALTLDLAIDDKVVGDILRSLYYPESPYEFSVLPPDILGNVYEQFLGKVIHLTAGHQARVEEKPEVKKAGGVYYTPKYIVDYIVEQTLGRMLLPSLSNVGGHLCVPPVASAPSDVGGHPRVAPEEEKTAGGTHRSPPTKEIAKLRILDPACGSGSFLVAAYRRLLDWHRDWYVADGPEKHRKEIYQGAGGRWLLATPEKKRILLNNIFGVDIDAQAVEVTKLNLLLCVLENENQETINQLALFHHERALPDLATNIKCGNSLIGPDFYEGQQTTMFDDETRYRINAFDWNAEFPAIMRAGGFDVVMGNPPYVRAESITHLKEYFEKHYQAFDGGADLYAYFMEKGVSLLRDGGFFSIIVSSSFLRTTYGEPLRCMLKKHAAVLRIVDFGGLAVFANAKDTYVCIPLLRKGAVQAQVEVAKVRSLTGINVAEYVTGNHFMIPHERLSPEAWALKSDAEAAVFGKVMRAGRPLGEYVERRFFRGVTSGLNDAFIIDTETKNRLIAKENRSADLIHPLLGGEDVRRYHFRENGLWLIFTRRGAEIDKYPAIREHLAQWRDDLTPKPDKSTKRGRKPGRYQWYEIQDDVAYYEVFDGPKLIFPDICKGPRFSLDTEGHYLANTAYCLGTGDLYLLGVLNSRLFWFAISNISIPFGIRAGEYRYRLIYQYMEKVPIRVIDEKDPADKARHDRMVELVKAMLDLHKRLSATRTPDEKTVLERQIRTTDGEIDRLVYELYGLTDEEIAIVEANA